MEQTSRETSLEERKRKDEELSQARKARQIRLGDIPAKEQSEEQSEEQSKLKPKPKPKSKSKSS
jgi:hypothetical protein